MNLDLVTNGHKKNTLGSLNILFSKFVRLLKKNEGVRWTGDFDSWEEANRICTGYNAENILKKVKEATIKVKKGEAAFERDSVAFEEIQYNWPLLATLLKIASENGMHPLKVIDFGGSLGSSYYQAKSFINADLIHSWNVVEQPHFVECGRAIFEDKILKFFNSINDVVRVIGLTDLVIFSSVLQYIPAPYEFLKEYLNCNYSRYLILDRTAFIDLEKERLTVQVISDQIIKSSYPHWFFNRKKLMATIGKRFEFIHSFDSYCDPENQSIDGIKVRWEGMVFKQK